MEPEHSILIVEDEQTLRRLLEYRLGKIYRVRTASNGLEALEKVQEEIPSLIVSDIMMPQMDGFALQTELQGQSNTRIIPFIFLTAKADEQSRARGLRTGVDDYITKPFDIEQLLTRIERLLERTRIYQTQLEGRIGQDFSQKLMPRRMPQVNGYGIHYFNLPREQGGGDFFDWVEIQPGVYLFTLGDVMGKGIQAKFYAFSFLSYVRGTIHSMMRQVDSPAVLMTRVNQILMQDAVMEETFASLLLFRWEVATNRITYCNAGHCRPITASPRGAAVVAESDMVLGLHAETEFVDHDVTLEPNMSFFAYTDGLLEQRQKSGEMVGERGLTQVARQVHHSPEPLMALTQSILEQSPEAEFTDDILAFWLKRVDPYLSLDGR